MNKYIIHWATTLPGMEAKVNKSIEDGFVCQGGICVVLEGGLTRFYQAMVLA